MAMLLYQFRQGTNPRRVILYLAEKDLDVSRHELDYANGEHRSAGYRAVECRPERPVLPSGRYGWNRPSSGHFLQPLPILLRRWSTILGTR